ncbi:hypothetical protein CDV55_103410 [Aspergillus turcosus]|nr:hypothetical protein CDV55_103410 [Aspergillus turcosus]
MADAHIGGAGLRDVNRGPSILIATSIVTTTAFLTVLARLYMRVFVIRNVGADVLRRIDSQMMGRHHSRSQVRCRATYSLCVGHGGHREPSQFRDAGIYLWAIGMVKVSIGLFLLRFAPKKGYKIFIWVVIALNILTDLIFAILPAFMLRHLQVNRRVKLSLVGILGLGVLACAASFIKLSILPNYGRTGDFLWDYTDLTIWIVDYSRQPPLPQTPLQSSPGQLRLPGLPILLKKSHIQSKPQTLASGKFDIDVQAQGEGPLTYQTYETRTTATYPVGEGRNSSEELILPSKGEGIICVTEVTVSHSQESEHSPK